MKKYKEFPGALISLILAVSITFAYQLKSDVLSNGGTNMVSTNYIANGTFSQFTASSAWLTSTGYKAVIGFWNPSYETFIHEKYSPLPG